MTNHFSPWSGSGPLPDDVVAKLEKLQVEDTPNAQNTFELWDEITDLLQGKNGRNSLVALSAAYNWVVENLATQCPDEDRSSLVDAITSHSKAMHERAVELAKSGGDD